MGRAVPGLSGIASYMSHMRYMGNISFGPGYNGAGGGKFSFPLARVKNAPPQPCNGRSEAAAQWPLITSPSFSL